MGAGEQIRDDFASAVADEIIKTRRVASQLGLPEAHTTDKLFTFVGMAIRSEAINTGPIQTELNPAITAFQRARDRVSALPQQVKSIDEYIEHLSHEYRKEITQVKKQKEKLRSEVKQAGEGLRRSGAQHSEQAIGEVQPKQCASMPAIVTSQTHDR